MRLAASVILYNQDESIYKNIKTYVEFAEKILVFDNSEKPSFNTRLIQANKIIYFSENQNFGIAQRLNQAISYCRDNNYTHLLTMDQDSSFSENNINEYLDLVRNNNEINIGMFGVCYDEKCKIEETSINEILITSGSIIKISIADKMGGFDENIFIDGVDTDFCLKLFEKGYKTIMYHKIKLNHSLGKSINVISPFLKKSKRTLHSSSRIYYLIRNNSYLRKKYPNYHQHLKWGNILNEIKNTILYGDKKLTTIKAILSAIKDFKNDRFGKYIQS